MGDIAELAVGNEVGASLKQGRPGWDDGLVSASRNRRCEMSVQSVPGTMWDYKTVVLTHGFMGFHKGELDRPKFEASLDELGREGYELTWVFMDQKLHSERTVMSLSSSGSPVRQSSIVERNRWASVPAVTRTLQPDVAFLRVHLLTTRLNGYVDPPSY